jgi:hypothetical protein
LEHVVPSIQSRFLISVARVLALPLLWSVFEDDAVAYLPQATTDRIREASRLVSQLPGNKNPVQKVRLDVSGNEGELYLDDLDDGDEEGGVAIGGNGGGARQAANEREQMQAIYLQMTLLWQAQEAHTTILKRLELGRGRDNKAMIADICRIAVQPMVRYGAPAIPVVEAEEEAGNNGRTGVVFAATLSTNPRSLRALWEE